MPGIYRPRHPERTFLYRVLFHYFERFLTECERRFEKEYGYFRPVVAESFAREVLGLLVSRGWLSAEWRERILSWRHSGFNVHRKVRTKSKAEG